MKIKPSLSLALVVFFPSLGSTVGFAQTTTKELTAQAVVQKCLAAYAALSSYSDDGKIVESGFDGQVKNTTYTSEMQRPNLFRVIWTQTYGNVTNTGIWRSAVTDGFAKDDSVVLTTAAQKTNAEPVYEWIPFALTDLEQKAGGITLLPDIFLRFSPNSLLTMNYTNRFEGALSSGKTAWMIVIWLRMIRKQQSPMPRPFG